jgi:hypothetical protein
MASGIYEPQDCAEQRRPLAPPAVAQRKERDEFTRRITEGQRKS